MALGARAGAGARRAGAGAGALARGRGRGVVAAAGGSAGTLYDVPVSNNGARVRLVLYAKGLDGGEFDIKSPLEGGFGGETMPEVIKGPGYRALHPQGTMPVLRLADGTGVPESEVINEFLVEKYSSVGPSFLQGAAPEARAKARVVARFHDMYMTTIQGCMYKKMEADKRAELIKQLDQQLDILEGMCEGPYFAGSELSLGDAAVFPTMIFCVFSLESKFGWPSTFHGRPKLEAWYARLQSEGPSKRVYEEVLGGLQKWDANGRWETLGITAQIADTQHKWVYP